MHKVNFLAQEPAFAEALKKIVKTKRKIFRAHKPQEKAVLDPNNPKGSLDYYYQIRSNIAHRGKAVVRDYEILEISLVELLAIFRYVLVRSFDENA